MRGLTNPKGKGEVRLIIAIAAIEVVAAPYLAALLRFYAVVRTARHYLPALS